MKLSSVQRAALREVDAYPCLPTLDVYVTRPDQPVHFSAKCGGILEQKYYLDFNYRTRCHMCVNSPQRKLIQTFEPQLDAFIVALGVLENIRGTWRRIQKDKLLNPFSIGGILFDSHERLSTLSEDASAYGALVPAVEKVEQLAAEVKEEVLTLLRSPEGKEAMRKHASGTSPKPLYSRSSRQRNSPLLKGHNALMFIAPQGSREATAVVAAFGKEVAEGKILVRSEYHVMRYLQSVTTAASLTLPKDISDDVIFTAATLWEPESKTAFGDIEKAFSAAVQLTPVST